MVRRPDLGTVEKLAGWLKRMLKKSICGEEAYLSG